MPYGDGEYGAALSAPGGAPGAAFHSWDATSRRRYATSLRSPTSAWSPPTTAAGASPAQPAFPDAGSRSGDPAQDWRENAALTGLRDQGMSDASAGAAGARLSAENAGGQDPSLSAYAALEGQLNGEDNASRRVGAAENQILGIHEQSAAREHEMRLQYQLQEEAARKANEGSFLGDLGSFAGNVAGSWLAPGGLWKGAGK